MSRVAASVAALVLALAMPATASQLNLSVEVVSSSTATTTTSTPPVIPSSGGGGGGGGGGTVTAQTGITVSGRAYPLSRVVILRDGTVVARTVAGPDAVFSVTLSRISAGTHTISVASEDDEGRESVLFSFPISVTAGAMTSVSGVFISPTIDLDKAVVRQGDPIAVFGQTAPGSQVTVTVHSEQEIVRRVAAQSDGTYLLYVDSAQLAYGDHTAQSFSGSNSILSPISEVLEFKVGTENVLRGKGAPERTCLRADVNCDDHVDLVDYSILAYWYERSGTLPARVDLNDDGVVTLIDLSILAYYWTG